MENSEFLNVHSKFLQKTVKGVFFDQAILTQHNPVVKQGFGQLPKTYYSQSRKFPFSKELALGGIKWNRSS